MKLPSPTKANRSLPWAASYCSVREIHLISKTPSPLHWHSPTSEFESLNFFYLTENNYGECSLSVGPKWFRRVHSQALSIILLVVRWGNEIIPPVSHSQRLYWDRLKPLNLSMCCVIFGIQDKVSLNVVMEWSYITQWEGLTDGICLLTNQQKWNIKGPVWNNDSDLLRSNGTECTYVVFSYVKSQKINNCCVFIR